MAGLEDLLRAARENPAHARAKSLAKSDYKLLADLVEARRVNGLSQEDVAVILGITQQAVSKLESYDSDPKLSTLRRYALAVGALVEHSVTCDVNRMESLNVWISSSYTEVHGLATGADKRRTYKAAASKTLDFALAA